MGLLSTCCSTAVPTCGKLSPWAETFRDATKKSIRRIPAEEMRAPHQQPNALPHCLGTWTHKTATCTHMAQPEVEEGGFMGSCLSGLPGLCKVSLFSQFPRVCYSLLLCLCCDACPWCHGPDVRAGALKLSLLSFPYGSCMHKQVAYLSAFAASITLTSIKATFACELIHRRI